MRIAFLSDNYIDDRRLTDPFRTELMKEFCGRSTEFLYVQCNDYLIGQTEFRSRSSKNLVLKSLEQFKPEAVFSLNRAGLITEIVSSLTCPIYSWYIDNPHRIPQDLRQPALREKVFIASSSQYLLDAMREDIGNPDFQWEYLPFCSNASVFRPSKKPVPEADKCDVSFVGTLWDPFEFIGFVNRTVHTENDRRILLEGFERYSREYSMDLHGFFSEHGAEVAHVFSPTEIRRFFDDFISSQRRLQVLSTLVDLNLEIYGNANWVGNALLQSTELLKAFRTTIVSTPQSLANLYQRTRVGLNIAHHQAQCGFPIRIFDLFNSGLPLVTDRHQELSDLFEEGRVFLVYDTPEEASEQVRRVLRDPILAQSMRSVAMKEVREKHTFAKRVDRILNNAQKMKTQSITFVSDTLDEGFLFEACGRSRLETRFVRMTHTAEPLFADASLASTNTNPANTVIVRRPSLAGKVLRKSLWGARVLQSITVAILVCPVLVCRLLIKIGAPRTHPARRRHELWLIKTLCMETAQTILRVIQNTNSDLRRRLKTLMDG